MDMVARARRKLDGNSDAPVLDAPPPPIGGQTDRAVSYEEQRWAAPLGAATSYDFTPPLLSVGEEKSHSYLDGLGSKPLPAAASFRQLSKHPSIPLPAMGGADTRLLCANLNKRSGGKPAAAAAGSAKEKPLRRVKKKKQQQEVSRAAAEDSDIDDADEDKEEEELRARYLLLRSQFSKKLADAAQQAGGLDGEHQGAGVSSLGEPIASDGIAPIVGASWDAAKGATTRSITLSYGREETTDAGDSEAPNDSQQVSTQQLLDAWAFEDECEEEEEEEEEEEDREQEDGDQSPAAEPGVPALELDDDACNQLLLNLSSKMNSRPV